MAAAARNPVASKKRKLADDQQEPEHPDMKKKSPLFNQPQNFYAPNAISSMSKDELSEWRKEQRRKRNRESAAASRNKTREKIEELEGEADKWKLMYHDMEVKMRCMERHIQFLTQLNQSGQAAQPLLPPPPVVSHPNSPPRSPPPSGPHAVMVPHAVPSFMPPPPAYSSHSATHLFPSLLSELKDYTLVEKQETAAVMYNEESRRHLIPIPRQASQFDHFLSLTFSFYPFGDGENATLMIEDGPSLSFRQTLNLPAVKITGADSDSSTDNIKQQQLSGLPNKPLNLQAVKITGADSDSSTDNIKQQQLSGLPMCDSMVKNKTSEEVDSIAASSGTPDEASVEAVSLNEMKDLDKTPELVDFVLTADDLSTLGGSSASDTSDDEDFLDLLVDSLDGEFDPNLLL
eukprot:CAMPEP_0201944784 /NCGR_PEP_ID=MMETSP0903-20130614/53571_1 /ASSEMBLY_ACC=CAM_ASM_000552 /TAXON_ID=420261 /ORGANISM="Thalassiosira antarctica, Strain CCMP982" /LENGTH=403 /DNA_ID=CAMNT_0048487839 /DNA_START=133 /DNA_END=1345 /DNA_ORIENTATION=-